MFRIMGMDAGGTEQLPRVLLGELGRLLTGGQVGTGDDDLRYIDGLRTVDDFIKVMFKSAVSQVGADINQGFFVCRGHKFKISRVSKL